MKTVRENTTDDDEVRKIPKVPDESPANWENMPSQLLRLIVWWLIKSHTRTLEGERSLLLYWVMWRYTYDLALCWGTCGFQLIWGEIPSPSRHRPGFLYNFTRIWWYHMLCHYSFYPHHLIVITLLNCTKHHIQMRIAAACSSFLHCYNFPGRNCFVCSTEAEFAVSGFQSLFFESDDSEKIWWLHMQFRFRERTIHFMTGTRGISSKAIYGGFRKLYVLYCAKISSRGRRWRRQFISHAGS